MGEVYHPACLRRADRSCRAKGKQRMRIAALSKISFASRKNGRDERPKDDVPRPLRMPMRTEWASLSLLGHGSLNSDGPCSAGAGTTAVVMKPREIG